MDRKGNVADSGVSSDFGAGSVEAFRSSWSNLPADERYHFARGEPRNQVQFAFQNHWRVFQSVMGDVRSGTALEVGCGRGSMGAFFADAGFETHLLDTSDVALRIAAKNFAADELQQQAVCGDALRLPYRDQSFDVVVSIGLLEHFEDIQLAVAEQMRILRTGGVFLGYVVPERRFSVQRLGDPLNLLLRTVSYLKKRRGRAAPAKDRLYRNSYPASAYIRALTSAGAAETGSFGMFPVPLISHSPAFPFSPMSPAGEGRLLRAWRRVMSWRSRGGKDPWICAEGWGLAFLVWAKK